MGLIPGEMFDGFEQSGVFLPHDLVELGGSHCGALQLLEGLSRVNGLAWKKTLTPRSSRQTPQTI